MHAGWLCKMRSDLHWPLQMCKIELRHQMALLARHAASAKQHHQSL